LTSGRLALLLIALLAMANAAGAAGISGHYRNLVLQTTDSRGLATLTDLNRLRLSLAGSKGGLAWEVAYDNEWLTGGLLRDPAYRAVLLAPAPTYADLEANVHTGPSDLWRSRLYRGWVRYSTGAWQLTAGRQRLAWGSGRVWNPTDRFNPVLPTAIEPDQKLGVDAVSGTWRYSAFGSWQAVIAPGRTSRGVARKTALRWRDTVGTTDVALMAGDMGVERLAGLDVTGNLGEGAYRIEAVFSHPDRGHNYAQVVAGYDYTVVNAWFPRGLYLGAEYFYDGLRAPLLPRLYNDRWVARTASQFALLAGYDIADLWRLDLALLVDPIHQGLFAMPQLTWSLSDNVTLLAMAQWSHSRVGGEYAGLPAVYVLRLDWYW